MIWILRRVDAPWNSIQRTCRRKRLGGICLSGSFMLFSRVFYFGMSSETNFWNHFTDMDIQMIVGDRSCVSILIL